jgi:hypothetical protein
MNYYISIAFISNERRRRLMQEDIEHRFSATASSPALRTIPLA